MGRSGRRTRPGAGRELGARAAGAPPGRLAEPARAPGNDTPSKAPPGVPGSVRHYPFAGVKRRILPVIVALAGAGLIALLVYGVSHQAASRTLDELVATGHYPPAPNASTRLPILDGDGMSSLGSLRGKVVVLNFWASWCQPCEQEAPLLERTESQLRAHRRDRPRGHLSRRHPRLPQLRPPLPPQLSQPPRQHRQLRPLLRHRPAPRELRDRPPGPHRRDLPGRDRRSASSTTPWRWRRARETPPRPHSRRAVPDARHGAGRGCGAGPPGLADDDRTPGDVRDLQNPPQRRRVDPGRTRAVVHPGTDRPGARRSPDQARPRGSVRNHRAGTPAGERLRPDGVPRPGDRGGGPGGAADDAAAALAAQGRVAPEATGEPVATISAADASRLDADLSRFD